MNSTKDMAKSAKKKNNTKHFIKYHSAVTDVIDLIVIRP